LQMLADARAVDSRDVQRLRVEPTDPEHLNTLAAVVRARGAEHDLSPSLLAPRRELAQLLRGERDLALLTGWRAEIVGNELRDRAEALTGPH
jgi:ribonuclease D